MPVFLSPSSHTARLTPSLAASILALAALLPAASAQTSTPEAGTVASLTAGPGDVMRVLPVQLLPALQPACGNAKAAIPAWSAQLDASAALLVRLNQVHVPATLEALPKAMLCTPPDPLAAAWRRAAEQASNLVKLDFSGAPTLIAIRGAKPAPAITGAGFIGVTGGRVLIVNRGAQAVRVRLGTWVGTSARLDQYAAPAGTEDPRQIRHVERALSARDAHGIVLPPMSLSVVG